MGTGNQNTCWTHLFRQERRARADRPLAPIWRTGAPSTRAPAAVACAPTRAGPPTGARAGSPVHVGAQGSHARARPRASRCAPVRARRPRVRVCAHVRVRTRSRSRVRARGRAHALAAFTSPRRSRASASGSVRGRFDLAFPARFADRHLQLELVEHLFRRACARRACARRLHAARRPRSTRATERATPPATRCTSRCGPQPRPLAL